MKETHEHVKKTPEAPGAFDFWQQDAFQVVARILITSTTVTTVLFPLEQIRTWLQTNTEKEKAPSAHSRNPFSIISPLLFNFGRVHSLVNGYVNSNKSSLVRNTMLTEKEQVTGNVDAVLTDEGEQKSINHLRQYASLVIATALIASGDTLLTQFHTNLGVFNTLKIIPKLKGTQKVVFASRGMLARGSKTFTTTLGCIASSTAISDSLNSWIPREGHSAPIHYFAAGALCGFVVAPMSNVGDVIYKNTLLKMDLTTLKMPRYRDTLRWLLKENGPRVLLKGSLTGGIYNTTAFVTFNSITWFLDNRVFTSKNRHSFFNNNSATTPAENTPKMGSPSNTF